MRCFGCFPSFVGNIDFRFERFSIFAFSRFGSNSNTAFGSNLLTL
jgi:hypothetical protein